LRPPLRQIGTTSLRPQFTAAPDFDREPFGVGLLWESNDRASSGQQEMALPLFKRQPGKHTREKSADRAAARFAAPPTGMSSR
jgi:hypothetical protein